MSVRVKALEKAVTEAKRFLEAAAVVKRAAGIIDTKGDPRYCDGQYCAAVKRASMDLTKALVDVRMSQNKRS